MVILASAIYRSKVVVSVAGAASTDNCGLPPTQVLRITPQNFSFPTCFFVLFDFENKV